MIKIAHKKRNQELKLQAAEPPVKRKSNGGDSEIPVVLGWLYRGEKGCLAEGCLHVNRLFIRWEIDEFGEYLVPIDTMRLEHTEGLSAEDIEKLEKWGINGLTWLLGGT